MPLPTQAYKPYSHDHAKPVKLDDHLYFDKGFTQGYKILFE
jgi:hypothetical protein